jgi:hypothetical protein
VTDPFLSPKQRLARAKRHVANLERRVLGFFKKKPYETFIEPHTDGIHEYHKLRLTKPLPVSITDSAAEAVEALRAALDQLGYVTWKATGATSGGQNTHFPIADDAASVNNAISKGRSCDIPADIAALFSSLQPYKCGNGKTIWTLNRVCNHGKHRLLVPVGTAIADMRGIGLARSGSVVPAANNRWDSEKDEVAFAFSTKGADIHYKLNIALTIAFGEIKDVDRLTVVPFLRTAIAEVQKIIAATETEARRINLI